MIKGSIQIEWIDKFVLDFPIVKSEGAEKEYFFGPVVSTRTAPHAHDAEHILLLLLKHNPDNIAVASGYVATSWYL